MLVLAAATSDSSVLLEKPELGLALCTVHEPVWTLLGDHGCGLDPVELMAHEALDLLGAKDVLEERLAVPAFQVALGRMREGLLGEGEAVWWRSGLIGLAFRLECALFFPLFIQ